MFRFGSTRESGTITSDQESRLYADRAIKSRYHQLAGLALQMKDALVKGELNNFGQLLHEGWELKKTLSSKISNGHIDGLYDAARFAGALGGKVLGAGGGGYLLVYCPPADQSSVIDALQNMGARQEYFDFVETGLETWTAKC
jgi:D-glycero-alpha-D-manno-heptose-7-phosphate kinase